MPAGRGSSPPAQMGVGYHLKGGEGKRGLRMFFTEHSNADARVTGDE